jgi:signal transduction histidine kinase
MELAGGCDVTLIDALRADMDFGESDERTLRALADELEPHLSAMAATITTFGRELDILGWLRSGLRGPWDATFLADRATRVRRFFDRDKANVALVRLVHAARMAYAQVTSEPAVQKLLDLELAVLLHLRDTETVRWQADQRAAMQTLAIGFAHELRNPLNSAKLQFDVLERRIKRFIDEPLVGEPARLARQEIERLCHLVEDFLSYAQPPPLAPVMCDIVTIAEHVVETEHSFAQDRGVELTVQRPTSRWHARVDCDKVRHAIKNLVRNGLEAAPRGGHVEVQIVGVRESVHVVVIDNGSGIPEKVRARMLEPFFSTKDTGTGLGMSIVQSVVAMHGGALDISSSSGGTRVDMSLPRAA